ncbi:Beta-galactosidase 7 [Nymphaea thermarum]|nr:Beta-galactosidase 7 [Nymphaea thermarum]
MASSVLRVAIVLLSVAVFFGVAAGGKPLVVSHDGRSLLLDGRRRIIISGSIHYPRSTPEMWPGLFQKAKEGGLDAIETYIFWNAHEPERRQYNFEGRLDFIKFVKAVQQAGLYAIIRIGPYVCAEWNYGGLPVWLHNIPGLQMRTNNAAFEYEMATFTRKIVYMIKEAGLLASQGGPIILLQIENEYGNVISPYGNAGKAYLNWAAKLALSMNVSVPWIMCQESDAPPPMINTCNGFYCDQFEPNSSTSPKMWTENWTGWFKNYGGTHPHRPVEDIAYAVARFFQTGGTLQNYYMYHGGTNFDRSAGGPFITTSYDYDAPLDEYGYARQPKWGHLKDLHSSLKVMEKALTYGTRQNITLGDQLVASIYKTEDGTSGCFLSNTNDSVDATVTFNGIKYFLPAWSVSILPDCKNAVFNSAKVNVPTSLISIKEDAGGHALGNWQWHKELVFYNLKAADVFPAQKLLEQISTTVDHSDYLWYSTGVHVSEEDPFWNNGQVVLRVNTSGHALHIFVNHMHVGFGYGRGTFVVEQPVELKPGKNYITLLSVTVGLQNYGAFFDLAPAGISSGPVELVGQNNATKDLSSKLWMYKTGLKGLEDLSNSPETFRWKTKGLPRNSSLTWYKAEFEAPEGEEAVVVDLGSMGKGYAWVNGKNIGRYWPLYTAPKNECSTPCDYKGGYGPSKCTTGCDEPTQRW